MWLIIVQPLKNRFQSKQKALTPTWSSTIENGFCFRVINIFPYCLFLGYLIWSIVVMLKSVNGFIALRRHFLAFPNDDAFLELLITQTLF